MSIAFSNNKKMKTKYKHISKRERKRIEELTQAGKANKELAEELWRSKSTIGRDLKRNWVYGARGYKHERAQELTETRRKDSKSPRISEKTWRKEFQLFNEDLSPEQISEALKLQGICVSYETIYRRIYAEILAGRLDRKHLRWERKKTTAAFAKATASRSLKTFDRKPARSQFQSGIRPLGRRYGRARSRAKPPCYDGWGQNTFYVGWARPE